MDQHDRLRAPEEGADLALEVAERVAMLGEEHELLARRGNRLRQGVSAVGHARLRGPTSQLRGREDLAEQVGELAPFGVLTAAADLRGKGFEALQRGNLYLQFGQRGGGCSLIEDLLFGGLHLVFGRLFQIVDIIGIQEGPREHGCRQCSATLQQIQLTPALLQTLPPAAQ